jgi:hypothetical protein
MVSSGLLRRMVLARATRRNNPEDTILQMQGVFRNIMNLYITLQFNGFCECSFVPDNFCKI